MKKAFQIVMLAILLITIKSEFDLCEHARDAEIDEDLCRFRSTSEDYTHCCYMELDGTGYCRQITDDAYDNIKRYKDYLKNTYDKVKIKCSSEFKSLTLFSLLSLIALIF